LWGDPDVSNCTTVEQIRLASQITDVERIVSNILNTTTRDLTENLEPEILTDIANGLSVITNTSTAIVPNDLNQTDQTLGSIVG